MYERHGEFNGGKEQPRLYRIWRSMRDRCINQCNPAYSDYGGRGIRIDYDWLISFPVFREWAVNNGYEDSLTIDRIDVNGHYDPLNCRWATMKAQSENKRNNKLIEIDGVTKTVKGWADYAGIGFSTVYYRYNRGVRGKALIEKPQEKGVPRIPLNARSA